MNLSALTTTVVSCILALGLIVSVTVLIASGETVPSEFIPLLAAAFGAAIGSARAAS